jgi:hypothetical protein
LGRLPLGDEAPMAIIVGKRVHLAATVHVTNGKPAYAWSVRPRVGTKTQAENRSPRCARRGAFFDGPQRPASIAAALAACKKHKAKLVIAKLHRLSRNVAFIATSMESGNRLSFPPPALCECCHQMDCSRVATSRGGQRSRRSVSG